VSEDDFWAALPLGRGVTLLNRDRAGLAALCKPAGILSHPNRPGEEGRSLLAAPYDLEGEFYHWPAGPGAGEPRRLWLLNRLDSATSGVILVAAGGALANGIRAQFKKKQVKKVYVALVFGRPARAPEVWRDRLAVAKRQGVVRTGAGPIPAECRMSLLRTDAGPPPLSLLRLEPRTGRSHQLRVQCADRHLPIVGDQTYGDFRRNRDFARRAGTERLFLHSLETAFAYELDGRSRPFAARAPLPEEFEALLG
jgi:23S rRNA-/tRNA-specific pseudouridylate synthase